MARSLAFWLVNPTPIDKKDTDVELHFNYWSLKSGTVNYLDIGVRLSSVGNFESIRFYLPFDGKNIKYCSELGKKVCSDNELIPAVFNAAVSKIEPDEHFGLNDITFEKPDTNSPIRFFTNILVESQSSQGGVKIIAENAEGYNGVIIEFPKTLFKFCVDMDSYFRFRIDLSKKDIESLSRIYDPRWSLITNYFESSEIVDFRVNEARNLPTKIRRELVGNSHIKKVHFFLIRDAKAEYRMSHDVYHRCRILEANIWDRYLGVDVNDSVDSQMLIYHWKSGAVKGEEQYIDHFSAFAKFTRRSLKLFDGLLVAVLITFLGVASSSLTNYIWSFFHEEVQSAAVERGSSQSDVSRVAVKKLEGKSK